MTDLEMTRLCAEAMGMESDNYVLLFHADGSQTGPFVVTPEVYDPLHDDAQAMALVKKMELRIGRTNTNFWEVCGMGSGGKHFDDDLNRAIVECAAKMQAAKK